VPGITLPANRELSFLCLHDQVVGFMMHWFDSQSFPCCVDREWCAGCKAGQTPRWTGYTGVISLESRNRFIVRIPQAAFRESGIFKDKSDRNLLVGTVFTSWRFGARPTRTRPVVIDVLENNNSHPRVKPFNLLSALSRWWKLDSLAGVEAVFCPTDKPDPSLPFNPETHAGWIADREKRKKGVRS
jgi:hypothetical protein